MRTIIANFLKRLTEILELFIALMLAAGIILLCVRIATSLANVPDLNTWPNYDDLLETCFNLIIGVELIRMVYYHTPATVFEVLIFAIARQIIIDHSSALSSLIGVCAIAVFFATRKYLFCEFDLPNETIFRATTKVKLANKLLGVIFHVRGRSTSLTRYS
ncbi:MAG: phosphate-starvation-inducible PsiE family protein [Lachnospiraceae bacterium]